MPNKQIPDRVERVNWRVNEFSAAYCVSHAQVYREFQAGRLSYIKNGKTTLIPATVADQWQADRLSEAKTR